MTMTKCCCCFQLRTGVQVLAILSIIGLIPLLIGAFVEANKLHHEDSDPQFRSSAEGLLGAFIFSLFASLILSGLLLYGANTNKRSFLIPWMVLEMVNIIFDGFAFLAALIVYFTLSIVTWGILLFLIPGAVFFGLKIYFWCVVQAFFYTMPRSSMMETV